jgi:hypothetical protein
MKKRETKPVNVKIQSGNSEALKSAHLYLFDHNGKLIEFATLRNGEAALKTQADVIRGNTQLIIGPAIPKELKGRELNPLLLKKMGGYQPSVHLNADNEIHITGLPNFPFPLFDWCLITGNLTKTFNVDGEDKALPVCDARVHICEVDRIRWWWWRIPIHIIDDLADRLKHLILYPEIPIPHGPGPDPGPMFGKAELRSGSGIQKQMSLKSEIKVPSAAAFVANAAILPEHVQSGLLSSSTAVVRDTIYNNFQVLHPYICRWPVFWPYFYFSHEIATVYTDCKGRFNYEYLNLTNDKDIYIWVEVCISGTWVTVYRPPVPCNTYWDYTCGRDISISITDSRVMPCSCSHPLQGELVWFRSIGEYATALHIEQGDSHTVSLQGVPFPNVGCTDVISDPLGSPHCISPFGSSLYFKLLFGDGLPSAGITHYRWRKTNLRDAALNNVLFPGTTVVNGLVQKTYFVITTDIHGHMHFETKAVTLGAEGSGENIGYRIPHWDIYLDPGVPAADKARTIQWTSPDFWSASIDSNSLSDGLWRFDLELLHLNASGVFQVVEVPKQVFQVSEYGNYGNSVDAPNEYLNIDVLHPSKAFNLKVKVRIDNGHCSADVQDATITVGGVTEYSGACGFLHYTDLNQRVHISFIASQPRKFAAFSFSVVKGNGTVNPGISQNGYVISSVGLYTLSGGIFSDEVLVSQLLGTCPQAAFAENLYVYSLATNGTRRLWEYDASDTNAFALSNT